MVTSVEVDEETKSTLEELRAEIRLETGRQATEAELLAKVVDRAVESKADLLDSFREEPPVLGEADRVAFHDGMVSSGVETTESDMDDELYR